MKKTACRPKVYLETSIPSYLSSRPSNDLRVCANQRQLFELYISELIIEETRKRRDELAQKLGGELAAICKALQEKEAETTRKVVTLQPRKARQPKKVAWPAPQNNLRYLPELSKLSPDPRLISLKGGLVVWELFMNKDFAIAPPWR